MIKKSQKEALTTAHYALLYEADPSKKWWKITLPAAFCFDYQTEELQGIFSPVADSPTDIGNRKHRCLRRKPRAGHRTRVITFCH